MNIFMVTTLVAHIMGCIWTQKDGKCKVVDIEVQNTTQNLIQANITCGKNEVFVASPPESKVWFSWEFKNPTKLPTTCTVDLLKEESLDNPPDLGHSD